MSCIVLSVSIKKEEGVSQARRMFCVPSDRVIKLGLRWL
jgi:hypothetical protein